MQYDIRKTLIPFLLVYVLVHASDGDTVRVYDGQTDTTITSLLAAENKTGDFITRQVFDAFVIAHTPPTPTQAEMVALQHTLTVDALNSGMQPQDKVQRAVYLVTLDEINLIRSLLVPAQTPRTIAQFKNAVKTKINSGVAD